MSTTVSIRKGLDIRLKGAAEKILSDIPFSSTIALKPPDFPGLVPKLLLKEGDKVQSGTAVFFDKYRDSIQYVSPVSGTIASINRGAKRRIMEMLLMLIRRSNIRNLMLKIFSKWIVIR